MSALNTSPAPVTATISPYAQVGARLIDAGYSALPIKPGTKIPGEMWSGSWKDGMRAWQRFCDRLPLPFEIDIWEGYPDAGVCVATGFNGLVAIDIDTDEPELIAAIMSVLPYSDAKKRGARGETLFFRGNVEKTDSETGEVTGTIPSRGFDVDGKHALDILAHGKQTVLPPTIHPDTRSPYQWITRDTLIDVAIEQLPVLPDNVATLLAEVLAPFGYVEPVVREYVKTEGGDNYWHDLKQAALANLDRWVPDLGLPKTHKLGVNWRAVAEWRGVKNTNLSFHPDGITDWGSGEGYTPIDVVMAALKYDDATKAAEWLEDRLKFTLTAANDNFNHAALIERSEAKKASVVELVAANDSLSGKLKLPPPIEIFWHGKDYNRPARSWLVKDLIPETGQGLASGQWGACKTFGVLDLSASVMTGTPFAGREVRRRGGVFFIAAEGANEIPVRLRGVVDHKLRSITDENLDSMPFAWIEECPSLKEDAGFNRLVAIAQTVGGNMKERFDLPLALIVIDTLSASADFADANDAAEGQRVMNRLNVLSRRSGSVVLAVDHFGKAVETGTRGTSAKEAAADFVLAFLANRDVSGTISNTRMGVRKLRGGATGAETPFDLKEVRIGDDETTCVIVWKDERSPQSKPQGTVSKNPWQSLKVFRSSVQTALVENGKLTQPYGNDGPKVRSVPLHFVRSEFVAGYPADGETEEQKQDAKRKAFKRNLDSARNKNLVCSRDIGGVDHIWLVDDK